jgi:hypothetical protein
VQHLSEIEGRPRSIVKNRTDGAAQVGSIGLSAPARFHHERPRHFGGVFASKKPRGGRRAGLPANDPFRWNQPTDGGRSSNRSRRRRRPLI